MLKITFGYIGLNKIHQHSFHLFLFFLKNLPSTTTCLLTISTFRRPKTPSSIFKASIVAPPLLLDLLAENEASLNTGEAKGVGRRFLNFGLADRDSRAPKPHEMRAGNRTPLGPGTILQAKTAQSLPRDEVEASRKRQRHWYSWAN